MTVKNGYSGHKAATSFLCVSCLCLMQSACYITNVGTVADAAKAEFRQDLSPSVKKKLDRLSQLNYAQMIGRFPERLEAVFLLAEKSPKSSREKWIGGGGISLVTDRGFLVKTEGLLPGISASEIVRAGAIADFLSGKSESLADGNKSVQKIQDANLGQWFELTGAVEKSQDIYYESDVFSGLVKEVTEKVTVTGHSGSLKRVYWIESKTRSLLRVEGDFAPDLKNVSLIWLRVPVEDSE